MKMTKASSLSLTLSKAQRENEINKLACMFLTGFGKGARREGKRDENIFCYCLRSCYTRLLKSISWRVDYDDNNDNETLVVVVVVLLRRKKVF